MNRIKIKKAMTVYDAAIAKMTFENDLKSQNALETWANDGGNCDNPIEYFKTSDRNKCVFRTSDGVWWDIGYKGDIMQPIVAVSQKALEDAQNGQTDGKNSFKFVTSFDSMLGTFRVNDLIFEKKRLESELANANEDKKAEIQKKVTELKKLFGELGIINLTKEEDNRSDFAKTCEVQTTEEGQPKQCKIGDVTFTEQTFTAGNYDPSQCIADSATCEYLATNSKAEAGTYFTTNIGGNITWDEAKTECAKMNAEVATTAQLQQMYSAGTLKCQDCGSACSFWASETTSIGSYTYGMNFLLDGRVSGVGNTNRYSHLQVVCVGN